jgi:hypothetical protein
MVSRIDQGALFQISAPVSPGNSGGPVFDNRGNLLGIVVFKLDRNVDPNAENLNFAVRPDTLLNDSGWDFSANGQQALAEFAGVHSRGNASGKTSSPATP